MTKKEKSKLEALKRQSDYIANKDYYNHRIATIMTMTPLFLEHFEELNEIMPQFFTSNVLKTIEQFSNSLYWKQSQEDLCSVADEQINNTEELRKFFIKELK
jgi:hypothetical protein